VDKEHFCLYRVLKKDLSVRTMEEILDKVRKTVEKYRLLEKGDRVLIATSGGADSTALTLLLLELQKEYNLALFLGHFNHKLRAQADEEEAFVRQAAYDHSLSLSVDSEDVRSYAKNRKLNLEEAGRILRYEFLRKTARRLGSQAIR
jgi:tRNA(Ile)-lysidine synthase